MGGERKENDGKNNSSIVDGPNELEILPVQIHDANCNYFELRKERLSESHCFLNRNTKIKMIYDMCCLY